ncbi:MAG: twin-arginine translocation signal domain-containing protein, partial [Gemmatimonadota bacterium]
MSEPIQRRDFLKILGVTGAGAAALGCSSQPASRLIPYLVQPEEIVPGIPTIYASVCRECPAGCGLHVRTREGRATKLEGNPAHPVNAGKLCARGEAGIQGLYHPDRIRQPLRRDAAGAFQPIAWDEAEALLVETLAAAGRGRITFWTGPDDGTFGRLVDEWLDAVGGRPRVAYDPFAPESLVEASRIAFGLAEVPE